MRIKMLSTLLFICVITGCFESIDILNQIENHEAPDGMILISADIPFYIDKYEVTIGNYKKFQNETGYPYPEDIYFPMKNMVEKYTYHGNLPKDIDNYPITNIQYPDAIEYAKWAKKRLPTKKEWEFAARGNTNIKYVWGDRSPQLGDGNFIFSYGITITYRNMLKPVGKSNPNMHGIYDLAGNVIEWTSDRIIKGGYYGSQYFQPAGTGGRVTTDELLIDINIEHLEIWRRDSYEFGIGFRCVKDVE